MNSRKLFRVVIKKRAAKKLEELPREVQQRILEVLEGLRELFKYYIKMYELEGS